MPETPFLQIEYSRKNILTQKFDFLEGPKSLVQIGIQQLNGFGRVQKLRIFTAEV